METVTGRLRIHLADRYRFEREIGAGGMATVYLAEDVKHHRRVALKVLRPELSALLGAERFLKEIEVTANLQHPHLLPLFDSGEVDGLLFYVMPYVEGESLRQKLVRERQLGIEEAVRIITQVASALDHAHRHGVIHRDIKPENILLHEGQALIADFGIALALREAGGDRLTQTGLSLGTPQYMSPEQAAGDRVLDARSDVYSLASVLYEMLAGEPPHSGPTVQSVIAKLLADAPRPVSDLRRTVPVHIAAAIDVALAKLPADRFESTADFARALTEPNARRTSSATRGHPQHNTSLVGWRTASGVAGAAALVLALLLWQSAHRSQGMAPTSRYREVVALAPSVTRPLSSRIAIAPDGSRLVYVGSDSARRLWVRAADSLDGYPLPGTEGAESPFFSPDGLRVGFKTADRNVLSIVELEGGLPSTPMQFTVGISGAAWANDGFIYTASLQSEQQTAAKLGLIRGRPDGNSREQVTTLDRSRGELDHKWPQPLPNGRGLTFVVARDGGCSQNEVAVVDLSTHQEKVLTKGVAVRYATTGHLLVVRASGALVAAAFDQERLRISGEWKPIASGLKVGPAPHCAVDLALSATGRLGYTTAMAGVVGIQSQAFAPVWVRRDGSASQVEAGWTILTHFNGGLNISPDGTRLALTAFADGVAGGAKTDIVIKSLRGGDVTRVTLDGDYNRRPSWTPDGRQVTFIKGRSPGGAVWQRPADLSEPARLLLAGPPAIFEGFWSPGREWLVYRTDDDAPTATHGDILAIRPGRDGTPRTLVGTEFEEVSPALSPDGGWLAYVSSANGHKEVYVRSFSSAGAGPWAVSEGGGTEPTWSHSGRELFYRNSAGEMVSATVRTDPIFSVVKRESLFDATPYLSNGDHRWYAISADDQQFLMLRAPGIETLVVVENLFTELRKKFLR